MTKSKLSSQIKKKLAAKRTVTAQAEEPSKFELKRAQRGLPVLGRHVAEVRRIALQIACFAKRT
jgi:hypothetical protein